MENKPMMAVTCLPTEEDYRIALGQERRDFARPGLFEKPQARRRAQIVVYLLLLGSAAVFILSTGSLRNLFFLLFCLFASFISIIDEPVRLRRKTREDFVRAKSKSASQNFFVWEDRLEIRSVYEDVSYPWSLLTEWSAGEVYLLRFGAENTRCIPARTLTQEQKTILEHLLPRDRKDKEG